MIPRVVIQSVIRSLNETNKILLLLGPRQAGKTTVLHILDEKLKSEGKKTKFLNCDIAEELAMVNTNSGTLLKNLTMDIDVLFIDEAQQMDNSGLTLKIIYDAFPDTRVIATGSSSFDLKNAMSDTMTGRYLDFILPPLSYVEIVAYKRPAESDYFLPELQLYGGYPSVYLESSLEMKRVYLEKVVESYLFKDVFSFAKVRYPKVIQDLTRALAYQIGSEVNEDELSSRMGIDRKTLLSYLDILEKTFVIFRLYPFSRNMRREIGRRYKVYFVDLGIRNALIGDFNSLGIRSDSGALWENFLISERRKKMFGEGRSVQQYFWRNYNGAEVDYLEIGDSKKYAWEIKSASGQGVGRGAQTFADEEKFEINVIDRENYKDFVG